MVIERIRGFRVSVAGLLMVASLCVPKLIAAEPDDELVRIIESLRQQDAAWDDLTVDFECEVWSPSEGTFKRTGGKQLRWIVTRAGWERVERRGPMPGQPPENARVWEEFATYNGEFSMTWDNQNQGSGQYGRRPSPFLNQLFSPKVFGLYLTGLELNLPISLADLLAMEAAQARIVAREDGKVVIEAIDPLADGFRLKIWLDPMAGYRPSKIESRDDRGLLTRFDGIEHQRLKGSRGDFWFPSRGIWHGVNPTDRSPGSQIRYRLKAIQVDRHPDRSEFLLSYPAGALLLNTDTNEGFYTKAATTPEDAPLFERKLMSIPEHDRLLQDFPAGKNPDTRTEEKKITDL